MDAREISGDLGWGGGEGGGGIGLEVQQAIQ